MLNLAKFSLAGQCICVSRSHCSPQQLRTSASGMCLPQHPKKINATTEGGKSDGVAIAGLVPPTTRVPPTGAHRTLSNYKAGVYGWRLRKLGQNYKHVIMQMAQRGWPENEKGNPGRRRGYVDMADRQRRQSKTAGEECKLSWLANMKNAQGPGWLAPMDKGKFVARGSGGHSLWNVWMKLSQPRSW